MSTIASLRDDTTAPGPLTDAMGNPSPPSVGAFGMVWNGASWDRERQALTDEQLRAAVVPVGDGGGSLTVDAPNGALSPAATLLVTATAAVNTGVTATLPTVFGSFLYITRIEVVKLYAVIGVAAGAGVIITSTNLPGNPSWTTEQLASAAGTAVTVVNFVGSSPLRSTSNTQGATIVCPAQLQTIWRINVSYFAAA